MEWIGLVESGLERQDQCSPCSSHTPKREELMKDILQGRRDHHPTVLA
jgi:hypothetical protein